ncbi:zinc-binding dehydrogenase [Pseudomonas cichorii]|nr:zinc-binding dehydrogenase [Pseudomonas cichorii]
MKPGGQLISISGPPTPLFADEQKLSWGLKQIMRVLSYGIRKKALEFDVSYTFVFMQANGAQLREISTLVESGAIKPVIDRSFPLESTAEALSDVEQGRAKGKVVIKVR